MVSAPTSRPGLGDFEQMAAEAFGDLPDLIRARCEGLVIRVVEVAPQDVLDDLGIADPLELTGLYDGIALTDRSVDDLPRAPDTVWLYRQAILAEWEERSDVGLDHLVAHVLVHEIAHHFGFDDARIAEIDPWWL